MPKTHERMGLLVSLETCKCVDGDVTWYSMARVVVMRNDDDYDSGRANAAFIASSPDLYAAI